MERRTRQRIKSSISLRVAIGGLLLIGAGVALELVVVPLVDGGKMYSIWAGITTLIGTYVMLLALLVLGILELLRYSGI